MCGVAAYYVKSILTYMLCTVQDKTELAALHTAYTYTTMDLT
jgi:hypothetical protein